MATPAKSTTSRTGSGASAASPAAARRAPPPSRPLTTDEDAMTALYGNWEWASVVSFLESYRAPLAAAARSLPGHRGDCLGRGRGISSFDPETLARALLFAAPDAVPAADQLKTLPFLNQRLTHPGAVSEAYRLRPRFFGGFACNIVNPEAWSTGLETVSRDEKLLRGLETGLVSALATAKSITRRLGKCPEIPGAALGAPLPAKGAPVKAKAAGGAKKGGASDKKRVLDDDSSSADDIEEVDGPSPPAEDPRPLFVRLLCDLLWVAAPCANPGPTSWQTILGSLIESRLDEVSDPDAAADAAHSAPAPPAAGALPPACLSPANAASSSTAGSDSKHAHVPSPAGAWGGRGLTSDLVGTGDATWGELLVLPTMFPAPALTRRSLPKLLPRPAEGEAGAGIHAIGYRAGDEDNDQSGRRDRSGKRMRTATKKMHDEVEPSDDSTDGDDDDDDLVPLSDDEEIGGEAGTNVNPLRGYIRSARIFRAKPLLTAVTALFNGDTGGEDVQDDEAEELSDGSVPKKDGDDSDAEAGSGSTNTTVLTPSQEKKAQEIATALASGSTLEAVHRDFFLLPPALRLRLLRLLCDIIISETEPIRAAVDAAEAHAGDAAGAAAAAATAAVAAANTAKAAAADAASKAAKKGAGGGKHRATSRQASAAAVAAAAADSKGAAAAAAAAEAADAALATAAAAARAAADAAAAEAVAHAGSTLAGARLRPVPAGVDAQGRRVWLWLRGPAAEAAEGKRMKKAGAWWDEDVAADGGQPRSGKDGASGCGVSVFVEEACSSSKDTPPTSVDWPGVASVDPLTAPPGARVSPAVYLKPEPPTTTLPPKAAAAAAGAAAGAKGKGKAAAAEDGAEAGGDGDAKKTKKTAARLDHPLAPLSSPASALWSARFPSAGYSMRPIVQSKEELEGLIATLLTPGEIAAAWQRHKTVRDAEVAAAAEARKAESGTGKTAAGGKKAAAKGEPLEGSVKIGAAGAPSSKAANDAAAGIKKPTWMQRFLSLAPSSEDSGVKAEPSTDKVSESTNEDVSSVKQESSEPAAAMKDDQDDAPTKPEPEPAAAQPSSTGSGSGSDDLEERSPSAIDAEAEALGELPPFYAALLRVLEAALAKLEAWDAAALRQQRQMGRIGRMLGSWGGAPAGRKRGKRLSDDEDSDGSGNDDDDDEDGGGGRWGRRTRAKKPTSYRYDDDDDDDDSDDGGKKNKHGRNTRSSRRDSAFTPLSSSSSDDDEDDNEDSDGAGLRRSRRARANRAAAAEAAKPPSRADRYKRRNRGDASSSSASSLSSDSSDIEVTATKKVGRMLPTFFSDSEIDLDSAQGNAPADGSTGEGASHWLVQRREATKASGMAVINLDGDEGDGSETKEEVVIEDW